MEINSGKTTWIDIVNPTEEDLENLDKKFHFHPVILDELKVPSARSRVENYDGYMFFVYHFPVFDETEKVSRRSEIDFLVTKNAVITVHYEELAVIGEFADRLKDPSFKGKAFGGTLHLIYELIEALIFFSKRQLRHIQEKVETISTELFKDKEKEILTKISYLKRDISEYRVIIRPQEHLLHSLLENGTEFWNHSSRVYLNDLIGDHFKLVNQLEDYREAVLDFDKTNTELMNLKTNQAMKTFTILSFMTFPFVLLVSVLGLNTADNPFLRHPQGFWIAMSVVVIGMILMAGYFKKKDWL
jgi:magnesium transporter